MISALLILGAYIGSAAAADWPEFRGPNGLGVYTGRPIPTVWGPDKNVVWKTPIRGLGWSSPIAVGGKLFLTTAVPSEEPEPKYSLRSLAVDAASGKVDWDVELFVEDTKTAPRPHKKNSHASPTTVSDGKKLWVHFGHMGTACLSLSGEVLWKNEELKYKPVHGNGASPILVDDLVVFCCDGSVDPFLVALDQTTGKIRWKTDRKSGSTMSFSFATCQLIEHEGRRMIVSPASNVCMGYDPKTGAELWRVKYPKPGWSLICRPIYAHGLLFISTGYVNQHILAFPPTGSGDLTDKIVWQTNRNVPNTPTPMVVGDELYLISDQGMFSCLDAKTGKVHFAERLAGRGYSASPILFDGKLFITSEDGIGQVMAVGKEFKQLARNDLNERTFATFVPVDGALFVRTESSLYRFEGK